MKGKLLKFKKFAAGILPLEADFLLHFKQFEDEEKSSIIDQIVLQSHLSVSKRTFDVSIDKRKYSYVKAWSEKILLSLDVDFNMEKLIRWEKDILTDAISGKDEKELLKIIRKTASSDFNFIKIYDIARLYRHYLQIRLRHKDYQIVHGFLDKRRTDYQYSKLANDKLHEVTNGIISDYSQKNSNISEDGVPWLTSLFYNENLDGYNRILAWIRIIFIAHNQRQYSTLKDMFVYFEDHVASGEFYSKRIITNFYSQYLLYYASMRNYKKAAYYGYLSIKVMNNDYLYYVNNLAAVLLRDKRPDEAIDVLQQSSQRAKTALNLHNKVSHTCYNIFALIDLSKSQQAENLAFVFLTAYKKEVLENRWHLFFTAYLKAMAINHNFDGILKVSSNYKLIDRDSHFIENTSYSPSIPWIVLLASYKLGHISYSELQKKIIEMMMKNPHYANSAVTHSDLLELTKLVLKHEFSKLSLPKTPAQ